MSKILQGKFEIYTSKADAIDKFMQMQGVCREQISGENQIEFYCSKRGEIIISDPPKRNRTITNSTNLFAEIIEQDGKTYVTYYTKFDKPNNILNIIFITLYSIIVMFYIAFAISKGNISVYLIFLILVLVFWIFKLRDATWEKSNSPKDSEILIKELEKRVEAVNLWDK